MELALAYKCQENITNKRVLEYIHFNREVNTLRIDAIGESLKYIEVNSLMLNRGVP